MFKLLAASAGVVGVAANPSLLYGDYKFETYLEEQGKSYASAEEYQQREAIFNKNLLKVQKHNAEYNAGAHTWFAAMNQMADLTEEEFQRLRSTKYSPSQHPVVDLTSQKETSNPDAIDWREKGAVTPVKNQGGCGSCWAFSATETVESAYQIATGKQIILAPQTYVNCVKNPHSCGGTGGCEGATMELAFNLTAQTGIALEKDLPYQGRDATCKPYKAAVKCTGYVKNPVNSAIGLETAIATKGPQAITVAAGAWQMYGGGVFHGCSGGIFGGDNTLDHGVQAVGYTKEYWIVRNSWAAGWGEKGFIRISRANDAKTFVDKKPADGVACKPFPKQQIVGGECGILFDTSYPTGVTAATAQEEFVQGGTLKLSWSDCSDSSYHGKVTSVSPDTLTLGQATTVTGSGTVDEAVTGGGFTIVAKAGPITENWTGEVCTAKTFKLPMGMGTVTWDGMKCPLAKGVANVGVDVKLSAAIPASLASCTIQVKATGASKENLLCMTLQTSKAQEIVV